MKNTSVKKSNFNQFSVAGILLVILLAAWPAQAKPKKKVFNNTPQEVFNAALRTARERHVVSFIDDKNLMFTFETGSSMLSGGFLCNASVEAEPDNKSALIINVQHKQSISVRPSMNAGDRMADKFYQQVIEELRRRPQQKSAEKPESEHVQVPPGPPSAAAITAAAASGTAQDMSGMGSVVVLSDPPSSDIAIDGSFVGNAPATLKLNPGKHVISVSQSGFKTWVKEINVLADSETRLNANLPKDEEIGSSNPQAEPPKN